jgi:predicted RNA-binding Zn ribbon-like protein
MNTVWADRSGVHDALQTTAQLETWWALIGFPATAPASGDDLASYRELRAALRRLAAQATDDPREHARLEEPALEPALETVNARVAREPLTLSWDDEQGFALDWPPPPAGNSVPDHVTALAREAARLLAADDSLLRACYGPGCVLYFVRQHTRREWCSAGCGNRARVSRHYHRARSSPSEAKSPRR